MRPGPALAVERRQATELLYECGRSFRARIRDAPDGYPILLEGGAGLRNSRTLVRLDPAECLRATERQLPGARRNFQEPGASSLVSRWKGPIRARDRRREPRRWKEHPRIQADFLWRAPIHRRELERNLRSKLKADPPP